MDKWCLVEDSNSVRRLGDSRRHYHIAIGGIEMKEFNNFIEDMEVDDLPLVGLKYTWFRSNGVAKDRLDRCLISSSWDDQWLGV